MGAFTLNLSIPQHIMRTFIVVALACMVSAISADITCDECLAMAGKIRENMSDEKFVKDQTDLLAAVLCPMTEDPAGCTKGLNNQWAGIAGVCGKRSIMTEATCEQCTDGMNGLASSLVERATVQEMIALLQGDALCATSADPAYCSEAVAKTIPFAMPVLGGIFMLRAPTFCCNFSTGGLCC